MPGTRRYGVVQYISFVEVPALTAWLELGGERLTIAVILSFWRLFNLFWSVEKHDANPANASAIRWA